jgi:hypothetical protein
MSRSRPSAESQVWPVAHSALPLLRIENPSRGQWIGAAVILSALGLGAYAWTRRGPSGKTPDLHPEGAIGPGEPCDLGPSYPGFTFDGVECAPTAQTPPGIYVVDDCQDFIFVQGDDGPQPDYLEARIAQAAATTHAGIHGVTPGAGFDPTVIVTAFLHKFWPECPWPPAPDAAERIVQLYMVLSVLVGRTIVLHGGRVLGHSDFEGADEAIGDRLVAMGFSEFRPEVVSEIALPQGPPGPLPPENQPPQGTFGEPTGPGQPGTGIQPGTAQGLPVPPSCSQQAYLNTLNTELPAATWTQHKTQSVAIFAPSSSACEEYVVHFGICISPIQATFGFLTDMIDAEITNLVIFEILDKDDQHLQSYADFKKPLVWKRQYACTIRYNGSKIWVPVDGQLQFVDEEIMDPCGSNQGQQQPKAYRWPSSPGGYQVTGQDDLVRNWQAEPSVTIRAYNKTLFADIHYSGLPYFQKHTGSLGGHPQDYGRASLHADRTTKFVATTKVWAIGKP